MEGAGELEVFDAGRCTSGYDLGFAVGQRFSEMIRSRMRVDLFLQEQLLPFASTAAAQPLLAALQAANRERYPRYWDELVGIADGSGAPLLQEGDPAVHSEEGSRSRPEGRGSRRRLLRRAARQRVDGLRGAQRGRQPRAARPHLRAEGHVAGWRLVLHRLHLRRRAPHLRLRLQHQRSSLHARLGAAGDRRGGRGSHRPELRFAGPAGSDRPRRRDAEGVLAGGVSRALLQPDGRQSPAHRDRRDRLPEPVRRPRGRPRALLSCQHVPLPPSGAGAGRELHGQGEEGGTVRHGLQGGGALGARRHR